MKKVLFPLLFLVLLILLAEAGLRIVGIQPGVYTRHRLNPYEFDNVFGWITRKNTSFLRISPDYAHYNYYGAQGFPVASSEKDKVYAKEGKKIAFIGNSFAESYYVPYEKSFPYLVDKNLTNAEIINLGVSGYTPGQYLMQARKYLPQFDISKVIIFYVPFQDIFHINRPFFPGGFAKPVFGDDLTTPINLPLKENVPRNKQLEDYSSLITLLQPQLNKWFGYVNETYDWKFHPDRIRFYEEDHLEALRYFKRIEDDMKLQGKMITVYLPSEFEFSDMEVLKENILDFEEGCKKARLECVVPEYFLKEANHYKKLYWPHDHHPSLYGSEKMAEFLTNKLR